MITARLYQQEKKVRADGKAAIYYVLYDGKKRKLIASKKYVEPAYFDNERQIVTKGADNSTKLNAFFKRKLIEFDDIVSDLASQGKEITLERVEQIFTNQYSKDFIAFAFDELKMLKGLVSEKTRDGYRERLTALKKYTNELPFSALNYDFLTRYKYYLVNVRKRSINGIYQDFACIRRFALIAIAKGEMKTNPFENFELSTEETIRNWHPREELLKLNQLVKLDMLTDELAARIDLLLSSKTLKPFEKRHLTHFRKIGMISEAVRANLAHYLFSCFTGLRLGDKREFDEKNIVNDRISVKTGKTGKPILIPFNQQARELLDIVLSRKLKIKGDKVNKELRVCMLLVNIDKHMTFHCSRHTFAINCILLGIDIITVRDWLGHRSVTTTEIYAKIADRYKDENMKKFDNFFETNGAS